MANFNKVILLGNLTRDPEMKFLPSGTPVAEFGMATNRRWTDQQTQQQREAVTFVDCRVMGRQAEVIGQYCRKGSQLFVEGRLEYRSWDGPDGGKRSKLDVFVESFQLLGAPREQSGAEGGGGSGGRGARPFRSPAAQRTVEAGASEAESTSAEPAAGYAGRTDSGGAQGGAADDDVPF